MSPTTLLLSQAGACSPHLRGGYPSLPLKCRNIGFNCIQPTRKTVSVFDGDGHHGRVCAVGNSEGNDVAEETKGDEDNRNLQRKTVWGFYAAYILWLILLPFAPGDPIWAIKEDTIEMLKDLSLNFFFILPALNSVGQNYMEAPVIHPTAEALFNFINAWSLMFGPLLVNDDQKKRWSGSVELLWIGQMFLTNIFLFPYMALRLRNNPNSESVPSKIGQALSRSARGIGLTSLLVGCVSMAWFFAGRWDGGYGGIEERWAYFGHYLTSDRAAYAFIFDLVLYSVFQAWLVRDSLREEGSRKETSREGGGLGLFPFVPFFGLALYLLFVQKSRSDSPKE